MNVEERAVQETKNWLLDVVIGCNFCPFAGRVYKSDWIRYRADAGVAIPDVLKSFLFECRHLDDHPDLETSLLILTNGFQSFDEYLTLVASAEELILTAGYEGIYQVASFHPDYLFEGSTTDDAANFTNRSVYPMLHLLKEESIEVALEHFPDPDSIPENNIKIARRKGLAAMEALRNACKLPA